MCERDRATSCEGSSEFFGVKFYYGQERPEKIPKGWVFKLKTEDLGLLEKSGGKLAGSRENKYCCFFVRSLGWSKIYNDFTWGRWIFLNFKLISWIPFYCKGRLYHLTFIFDMDMFSIFFQVSLCKGVTSLNAQNMRLLSLDSPVFW